MNLNSTKTAATAICMLAIKGGGVTLKDGRQGSVIDVDASQGCLWVYPGAGRCDIKVPACEVESFH